MIQCFETPANVSPLLRDRCCQYLIGIPTILVIVVNVIDRKLLPLLHRYVLLPVVYIRRKKEERVSKVAWYLETLLAIVVVDEIVVDRLLMLASH